MKSHSFKVGVLLALAVISAGCWDVGSQPRVIKYDPGEISVENGTFRMSGSIIGEAGTHGHRTYSDVTIILYDEEKREIQRVPIGTVSTNGTATASQEFNVTSETIPKYIVISSPDFWETDAPLQVVGRYYDEKEGGVWRTYLIREDRRFPDDSTNSTQTSLGASLATEKVSTRG